MQTCNASFESKGYPLHLVNVGSVWGIRYTVAGRYHWMFQAFILDQGIKLSSIGTGRMNLSLETTPEEFKTLTGKLMAACERMVEGGWWNEAAEVKTTKDIFKVIAKDVVKELFRRLKRHVLAAVQSVKGSGGTAKKSS